MKNLIVLIICIFASTFTHASDHYKIGDKLFVWAKNGLNLRSAPNANAKKVSDGVVFGESLTVITFSQSTYDVKIDQLADIGIFIPPLILDGNWVKVKTNDGDVGFVIDQYLLRHEPVDKSDVCSNVLNLPLIAPDTVFYRNTTPNQEGLSLKIKHTYAYGIKLIEKEGNEVDIDLIYFQNSSIEEVYILLSSAWERSDEYLVEKNWDESILLSNEFCWIYIDETDDVVVAKMGCSTR